MASRRTGALPLKDFRNKRFKLVPLITDGPWVVRTAVRSQPAILGQKVALRHFRGPGYVETDVQVRFQFIFTRSLLRFPSTPVKITVDSSRDVVFSNTLIPTTMNRLYLGGFQCHGVEDSWGVSRPRQAVLRRRSYRAAGGRTRRATGEAARVRFLQPHRCHAPSKTRLGLG